VKPITHVTLRLVIHPQYLVLPVIGIEGVEIIAKVHLPAPAGILSGRIVGQRRDQQRQQHHCSEKSEFHPYIPRKKVVNSDG
jgi:hypothetical protein